MLTKIIISSLLLTGCGVYQTSPWQTATSHKNLTETHLGKITPNNKDLRIKIAGDSQMEPVSFGKVVYSDLQEDFTVLLGDITDLGLKVEWDWVGHYINKSNSPVLTVVGNHDGLSLGKQLYKKMFGPLNYSFEYKGFRFIFWNNNAYEWKDVDFDWLRDQVNSHKRVVVLSHQPPYAGTLTDAQEAIWKEIRKAPGYKISLHGHMHKKSYAYEEDTDTRIYVVNKVSGGELGLLVFKEEGEKYEIFNCKNTDCEPVDSFQ